MPRTVWFVREGDWCASGLLVCTLVMLSGAGFAHAQPAAKRQRASPQLPSVQEMIASRTDVWGDAAMRQPNGASYEFFENLLPPLRWVNTDFRHYPIVLSARVLPRRHASCRTAVRSIRGRTSRRCGTSKACRWRFLWVRRRAVWRRPLAAGWARVFGRVFADRSAYVSPEWRGLPGRSICAGR